MSSKRKCVILTIADKAAIITMLKKERSRRELGRSYGLLNKDYFGLVQMKGKR
jgi:hypothetical protein